MGIRRLPRYVRTFGLCFRVSYVSNGLSLPLTGLDDDININNSHDAGDDDDVMCSILLANMK